MRPIHPLSPIETLDGVSTPRPWRRRAFVAGMLAPFALPALARAAKPNDSHWHAGGIGGVMRSRYTVDANTYLPEDNVVYLLPLNQMLYDEGTGVTFKDQQLTITQDGLYRIYLVIDWPGQSHGLHPVVAKDLRYDGVRRIPIGQSLNWQGPNKLTIVGEKFDKLAVTDIPGSDPPQYARSAENTTWSPGTVPANGVVYIDVALDTAGIVVPGDAAQAALSTITDGNLGTDKELALDLSARIITPDKARVVLRNFSSQAIAVPAGGTLNVLAGSLTNTRGQSADAWNAAITSAEYLLAGETIIGVWKSRMKGDYLQKSNMTFLQIERYATL
jgi:hypothetical protein